MTNINRIVWNYIDRRVEIKKAILSGLINVSALARKIAKEESLEKNVDAVISAVRRYEGKTEKKERYKTFYMLLKKAKISTKTKLASLLIKRNDETQKKAASIYSKINLKRDSTLRVFEVTNYIKIIMDQEMLEAIKNLFYEREIENVEKKLGELTINYNEDVTKIPGVFATLSNELALNDISIVDSMICHWEHLIIVKEEDLEKSFAVIFNLTRAG